MKRDVLYVDDEVDNLIVFEATFEHDFNVCCVESGPEALELLETRPFPVVLSDQRMPGMTGAQLFEIMRRRHPHTRRVMLTGYADSRAMLDAINQGQVYHFLKKPWERDLVFSVLVRAIDSYELSIANSNLTERLVAMDRCAALGRSAAVIAHEMGNRLNILPLLELIEEQYGHCPDLVQTAGYARQMHERLCELIGEVKSFVRFQNEAVALAPLDLAEMLHELLDFLRYDKTLPLERLDVRLRAEPSVLGNKVKLQQVVINLLKNAADAIRDVPDGRVELTLDAADEMALLVVRDSGVGMTNEVRARIWEPFFTTKGDVGNGLGLDVVRTIVEAHGGTIECRSAPGAGATFGIRLPTVTPAAAPVEQPANFGCAFELVN